MLVSASDPSAVIKLSEKESRTTSEIWREGCVCQINPGKLGSRPAPGGGSLPSDLHEVQRTEVRGSVGKRKKWPQMHYLRRPLGRGISRRFESQLNPGLTPEPASTWLKSCRNVSVSDHVLKTPGDARLQVSECKDVRPRLQF